MVPKGSQAGGHPRGDVTARGPVEQGICSVCGPWAVGPGGEPVNLFAAFLHLRPINPFHSFLSGQWATAMLTATVW